MDINEDISIDFKVTTTLGTKRLARAAFEYAKKNGLSSAPGITTTRDAAAIKKYIVHDFDMCEGNFGFVLSEKNKTIKIIQE